MTVFITYAFLIILSLLNGYWVAAKTRGVVQSGLALLLVVAVTTVLTVLVAQGWHYFANSNLAESMPKAGGADMAAVAYILFFVASFIFTCLSFIFVKNRKSDGNL